MTSFYTFAPAQPRAGFFFGATNIMTPGVYALDLYRGDTYRWQFTLWSDADKTVPVDLTDVIPKAQIRDKPAGKLLATIDCVVTLPNIIMSTLTAPECAKLTGKTAAWDLQLEWPNTDITTLLAGPVAITIDVTDSAPATVAAAAPQLVKKAS